MFDSKKMSKEDKFELFESNVSHLLKNDIQNMSFQGVDLVFFPICRQDHFYTLVFDIRKPPVFKIIDNSGKACNFTGKYKRVCNLVQYVFGRHLTNYSHSVGHLIEKLKPKLMKISWSTRNNDVDCGVFTMHHMETYMGEAEGKWDCDLPVESEEQKIQLRKLRMRFACKILSHEMNIYASKMLEYANKFNRDHSRDEIKGLVLFALETRQQRVLGSQEKDKGEDE